MLKGGWWISTCWTTVAKCAFGRSGPAQQGQTSRACTTALVICSGGKGTRSCLGCPGCPPIWRGESAEGLGGLTMSEEGGLEEVEESLRAAASCSSRRATVACNCCTCSRCVSCSVRCASNWARCFSTSARKRWHSAQGVVAASVMLLFYAPSARSARFFRRISPYSTYWECELKCARERLPIRLRGSALDMRFATARPAQD